ncbi:hypothetical protein L6R53_14005 [Myxococcota bacterium]|nr:hypothetical protein [Myxococcota bacterium]
MTGNSYTNEDIAAHFNQMTEARGWSESDANTIWHGLTSLSGWDGWGDNPAEDWYPQAAAYLRASGLSGADKLADLYDQRPAMDAAQAERDYEATVGVVTGTAQGSLEDVAAASSGVANTIEAAAKSSKTPWLIGLGLVVTGLVAWRSR